MRRHKNLQEIYSIDRSNWDHNILVLNLNSNTFSGIIACTLLVRWSSVTDFSTTRHMKGIDLSVNSWCRTIPPFRHTIVESRRSLKMVMVSKLMVWSSLCLSVRRWPFRRNIIMSSTQTSIVPEQNFWSRRMLIDKKSLPGSLLCSLITDLVSV